MHLHPPATFPGHRFGIDLGGTKIEGAILDAAGEVLYRRRIPTESEGGYEHVLSRIAALYADMVRAGDGHTHVIGIGTPGSLSPETTRLRNSNTLCLNGMPLGADLAQRLGRPVRIENDANCFALAEAHLGAARGYAVVFGVILGTGCGGGIVWQGRVHTGRNRLGGEWGHMLLDPAGPPCYCGARGCVETFISGSGLERQYRAASGETRSAESILQAAEAGDPAARAAVETFFSAFGQAMANLVDVLDPDVIVLGGGLSNVAALYGRGRKEIAARVFGRRFDTPLLRNALGDSAGVIGAALLAGSGLAAV